MSAYLRAVVWLGVAKQFPKHLQSWSVVRVAEGGDGRSAGYGVLRPHRIGSRHLLPRLGFEVHGVDNNQRAVFFGPQGDTRWNQQRLQSASGRIHATTSSTSATAPACWRSSRPRPTLIVHAAAQPSHDRAAAIPFDDFDTNAVGTLNLLEAARRACPESPFVHLSTNKVYGDAPTGSPCGSWRPAGTTPTRLMRTASRDLHVDQSSIRSSAPRRSPPT